MRHQQGGGVGKEALAKRGWKEGVVSKEVLARRRCRRGEEVLVRRCRQRGIGEEGLARRGRVGGVGEEEALARMRHAGVMINNNVITKNKLRRLIISQIVLIFCSA